MGRGLTLGPFSIGVPSVITEPRVLGLVDLFFQAVLTSPLLL